MQVTLLGLQNSNKINKINKIAINIYFIKCKFNAY
jgi:hypothetical protein